MSILDDIAAKSKVSRSSVAKILRGKPGFNENTRQRVLKVAKQLNYRPSYVGRALAGAKSMSVGLVTAASEVIIHNVRRKAVELAAKEHGYCLMTVAHPTEDIHYDLSKDVQDILDRRIDGLLVYTPMTSTPKAIERICELAEQADRPVVFVQAHTTAVPGPHVRIDLSGAFNELASHLQEMAHRTCRYIPTTSDLFDRTRRVNPLRKAIQGAGLKWRCGEPYMLDPAMPSITAAYQCIEQMIHQGDLPDVLLMSNDETAIAAIAALSDQNLRVPDDVSVVGFDDMDVAAYCRPALTTIAQPRGEVGAAAFDLLLKRMNQPDEQPASVTLESQLKVRQSTGACYDESKRN